MIHSDTKIDVHSLASNMVTRNRKRLMGYGILTVIFGFVGLYLSTFITTGTILIVGIFILIVGIIFGVEALSAPNWKGKLLNLLLSILYIAAGVAMISNPQASAVWLTLFLAIFLAMIGILRIIMAFQIKSETRGWTWVAFGGSLNIILGILIYMHWPESGLWVIGMFISIELIINGVNAIILSSIAKKVQNSTN